MDSIQLFVSQLIELLIWPFRAIAPLWSLVLISILSGIVLLFIYGWVSPQNAIKNAKRRIHAALLEAILYRHDIGLTLRAQGRMFANGAAYFLLAVPPIVILAVPCVIMLSQLNQRYAVRGLHQGERATLTLKVEDRKQLYRVKLALPEHYEVTPPLRVPETQEVVWRVEPLSQAVTAPFSVELGDSGATVRSDLVIGEALRSVSADAHSAWWWRILYPDTSLRDLTGLVSHLSITYPERTYNFLGFQCSWLVIFLIVSIASGIVASRVFRVEI